VATMCTDDGGFDAVYDLALLDPCDDGFCSSVAALGNLCRPGGTVHLVLAGGLDESRLNSVGRRLAEIGVGAASGWAALLGGALQPRFADPNVEPYLCADIDGAARPIAAIELTWVASSSADAPALARLAV
jgi:hypothetical protein